MAEKTTTIDLQAYILQHFYYHNDGTISRDDRKNSNGCLDSDGYLVIKVKGKKIRAHRMAWLLNYGVFPDGEIDHINRNRTDNRIENLRIADRVMQCRNATRKINKDTGVQGIYKDKSTRGLKAVYTFHCMGKTYRFRALNDAIKKRNELRGGI